LGGAQGVRGEAKGAPGSRNPEGAALRRVCPRPHSDLRRAADPRL